MRADVVHAGVVRAFFVPCFLGIGVGGFEQLAFNFTIGDTPKSGRPMFIAVYSATTGVSSFLGPLIGGWLYEIMNGWPEALGWMSTYGFQVGVGAVMLLLAFTLGALSIASIDQGSGFRGYVRCLIYVRIKLKPWEVYCGESWT